jgi:hypothetical protein
VLHPGRLHVPGVEREDVSEEDRAVSMSYFIDWVKDAAVEAEADFHKNIDSHTGANSNRHGTLSPSKRVSNCRRHSGNGYLDGTYF